MKKYFLLSVACLFASVAFSQVPPHVIFDGEGAGVEGYTNPWWGVDATVEVVGWLQKDGTNAADPNFGATIWRNNENPGYIGGGINLDLDISAYNKISVDISKRVSGNVQVELQNGDTKAFLNVYFDANGSGGYGAGTWQTLTFDIPAEFTHLTALLVAPHNVNTGENPINFDEDNERHRMSWDNVKVYYDNITTTVLPNANADSFRISAQNGSIRIFVYEPKEVEIYNISGILLNRQTVVNEITIALNSGIYFVKSGKDVQKIVVK
jgi:hypothetical protein